MATLKVTVPENSLDILGTVEINAPIEKVFEAFINKDLFVKWFCRGNTVSINKFEGKTGGTWDIAEKSPDGNEWGFYGVFHEILLNERIIWTFEFMGMPERGHVSLEKMVFEKVDDGSTRMKTISTFLTKEDREGMVASGMEAGWRQSIEALGKLVGEK
jgi:uncharacterized protein YndB with AHSA1/START domain